MSVERISKQLKVPKREVNLILKLFFKQMKLQVIKGHIVQTRLGTFSLNQKGKFLLRRKEKVIRSNALRKQDLKNKRKALIRLHLE